MVFQAGSALGVSRNRMALERHSLELVRHSLELLRIHRIHRMTKLLSCSRLAACQAIRRNSSLEHIRRMEQLLRNRSLVHTELGQEHHKRAHKERVLVRHTRVHKARVRHKLARIRQGKVLEHRNWELRRNHRIHRLGTTISCNRQRVLPIGRRPCDLRSYCNRRKDHSLLEHMPPKQLKGHNNRRHRRSYYQTVQLQRCRHWQNQSSRPLQRLLKDFLNSWELLLITHIYEIESAASR